MYRIMVTLLFTVLAWSNAVAQSTISSTAQRPKPLHGELSVPETEHKFFSSGAVTLWPFDAPHMGLESRIYHLKMYGAPRTTELGGQTYAKENVAIDLSVNACVVDGFGDGAIPVKQYLFSKRGSPLTVRGVLWDYESLHPAGLEPTWHAGHAFADLRYIPVPKSAGIVDHAGCFSFGYSQGITIDIDARKQPARVYLEASIVGNVMLGATLLNVVYQLDASRPSFIVTCDYRVGICFADKTAISLTGAAAITRIHGLSHFANLVLSREVF